MEHSPDTQESNYDMQQDVVAVPTEAELTLLCLDHLRDLRRAPRSLRKELDEDYLSIACWALSKAFCGEKLGEDNDAFFDPAKQPTTLPHGASIGSDRTSPALLPSLEEMEHNLLYQEPPEEGDSRDEPEPYHWYNYDDGHPSNSHRYYTSAGLGCCNPLSLGEITSAGLSGLGARARLEAEKDLIQSPLFEQFLSAVQAKGFFVDKDTPEVDPDMEKRRQTDSYEQKYRKVIAKFRSKICSSSDSGQTSDLLAYSASDLYAQQRTKKIDGSFDEGEPQPIVATGSVAELPIPPIYAQRSNQHMAIAHSNSRTIERTDSNLSSAQQQHNPADLEEAEKYKNAGNTHMQRKEYREAADCYTQALKLSPTGPNSHVYFSNRAAALVSIKMFREAIQDSERSLALKPDYGKAHARLGLSHFLLGNYRQAMEAYTVALKYEPENKSSKNYLEKAAKRLAEAGEKPRSQSIQTSYSVVSEWDQSRTTPNRGRSMEQSPPQQQQPPPVVDEREAEKYKVKGNSAMASRDYEQALEAYSAAIQLNPSGSQSHVYYSNRAAALCYLERYVDAERDSLKSLTLKPTYGKAHARLGLSRFFMQDYVGAVNAYTKALEFDPNNAASKSYLAKAQAKLDAAAR